MRMDENHILVFTHEHAVRIVKRSEDFKCVGIILSKAYWEETLLHTHAFNALTRTVPCLPIEPDQKKPLLDFFSNIRTHTKLKDAENRNENNSDNDEAKRKKKSDTKIQTNKNLY